MESNVIFMVSVKAFMVSSQGVRYLEGYTLDAFTHIARTSELQTY